MLKIALALSCLLVAAPSFADPAADVIAINAGSLTAAGGFQADQDFSGGDLYANPIPINRTNAADPASEAVYQSQRFGSAFGYFFSNLQPGTYYKLRLHFAELYWNEEGERVFNVSVNGAPMLSNFDVVAAAGGKGIALVRELTVEANSAGNISIDFTAVTDNAVVNGIELALETPVPPKPNPGYNLTLGADRASYTAGQKARIVFSLQNTPDNENYEFFVRATWNGADLPLTRITDTQSYAVTSALAAGESVAVGYLYLQNREEAKALNDAIDFYSAEISRLTQELAGVSDPDQIAAIQAEIAKDQNRLDSTRDHLNQVRTPVGAPVSLTLNAQ